MPKPDLLDDFELDADGSIEPYRTAIRVLGIGGAGNNTLQRLMKKVHRDFETFAVNTDAQDLLSVSSDRKILIGKNITGGLGSGGDPQTGERSAEESLDLLRSAIEGTDLLFMTGGMGGGTGTGAMPVVGRLARDQGILTVAIVTMPFSEEGMIRWENAQIGLEKLRKSVDTVIVLRNDKLYELYPDAPILEAFQKGDEILINALEGLSAMVMQKGLINLDFADISMVMRDGPHAVIGLGESRAENRIEEAVRKSLTHPMMEVSIAGAQSALLHLTGGTDLSLKEARLAVHLIAQRIDPSARILWGLSIDKSLKQAIRIMVLASGLKEPERIPERKAEARAVAEPSPSNADVVPFRMEAVGTESGRSIFDIKESILSSGTEVTTQSKPKLPAPQTSHLFYKMFQDEANNDLRRFDKSIHALRQNAENRKALFDALQSCKLLLASAQMFGFDEIGQLLSSIQDLLLCVQSREMQLTDKVLDSLTLAMEMVVDLMDNRSDGRGETGYIVDRLKELKGEQTTAFSSSSA